MVVWHIRVAIKRLCGGVATTRVAIESVRLPNCCALYRNNAKCKVFIGTKATPTRAVELFCEHVLLISRRVVVWPSSVESHTVREMTRAYVCSVPTDPC